LGNGNGDDGDGNCWVLTANGKDYEEGRRKRKEADGERQD
jgi:hypothetical protein